MFKTVLSGLLISMLFIAKANAGGYATVDFQLALETVKDGTTAKAKLEKEYNDKQKMIQSREEEIKKLTAEFEKKQIVMTPEKRAQEGQNIQKKMDEYKNIMQNAQVQMQKKQMDLLQPIQDKMILVVQEIAEKDGYDLVYVKNHDVVYAKNSKDITTDVIEKYNAMSGDTTTKKKETKKGK